MSSSEALNYQQLVCECPHGHLLGTIVETRSGLHWGDRPLRDKRQVSTTPITFGEKIKADCAACGKAGRHRADYQASWKRVAAKLAEARDTRAERTTLIFG